MSNVSIQSLIAQRTEVLENIKQIEETCEGIENEQNAQKINTLNMDKAKLMSDKNRCSAELARVEQALNKINEAICKLSGTGIDKILEAIKSQRWYFIKNKPKILVDKNTGIMWANLDYFPYNNSPSITDAKTQLKMLELDNFKNWQLPSPKDISFIVEDSTFPFKKGSDKRILDCSTIFINTSDTKSSMWLDRDYPQLVQGDNSCFLPINTFLIDNFKEYPNNITPTNKIYTEKERLQFTLNLFINNKLEPIFTDPAVTELYKKIYFKKPVLMEQLNELQGQIHSLQQEILLSSNFDYHTLLVKYEIKAIDNSIIKYYEAVQHWIDELMNMLHHFENVKSETIRDFNIISLKLSKKYEDNPTLTTEENALLKNRQYFFKKHFELGMNNVKNNLLSIKQQADYLEERLDDVNNGGNAIRELAILERSERVSFGLIAENTATMVKNALRKIEYFEQHRAFATTIIKLEGEWTENYKVFKTTIKEQFRNSCEEDSIEPAVWSAWYEDWQAKRYMIEQRFLPLVDKGLKGEMLTNKLQAANGQENNEPTVVEKLIALLQLYKNDLDKFYLDERKNAHQKFAFQAGGELQEKFEVESELYKITSTFQKHLQDIIFSLDKSADRIFLLKWADCLLDIQIDVILDFVKDKEISKISQNVLTEFANLKRKNYESFITDAKAYSEERANREKQYNSLLFKMRKELMK